MGWVHINAKTRKLYFWRELSNYEHEAEMSRIGRGLKVRDILRFTRIPPDWRKQYQIDGVILTNDKVLFWEHDRDSEQEMQILGKMRKLTDCDVLWTCPHEERLTELIGLAPTDRHWFTTYNKIINDPHGQIFQNRAGLWDGIEIDQQYGGQSGIQDGVQYEENA